MSEPIPPSYPGGFPAILRQMERRLDPLQYGPGEALPPLDCDLAALMARKVDPTDEASPGSRTTYARKFRELSAEFDAQPELLRLHGLLIANLRRSDQPPQTAALFQRLWAEQGAWLLARLDARWQVSAITTFGDHGTTETQRRLGQSLSVLFAMMKLYESERLYSGLAPSEAHAPGKRAAPRLPLDMDPYALAGGGLDVNLLGRLWQDAAEDAVIAPLAQSLLDQLIHDPGGIFRRLSEMRATRRAELAQKGVRAADTRKDQPPVAAPVPQALRGRAPDTIRWGTVTLTNAPLHRIAAFAAHHLDLGAAAVHLYLDRPDPEAAAALSQNPAVHVTTCDAEWWAGQKKSRMRAHQMRQSWVATQCYKITALHWLAHVDVDEFLLPRRPLPEILAAVPDDMAALLIPPVELLAEAPGHDGPARFKTTPRMAGHDKLLLDQLYPTFGMHLRGGYVSHLEGKLITRTGIAGLRLGLHGLIHNGAPVENRARAGADDVLLGHAHAPDWETFRAHLAFRMTRGSYRKADDGRFRLRDMLDYLSQTEGDAGLRGFFDEVCTARPDLVAALDRHGMLVTWPMDSDAAIARHFGPLPEGRADG